ncbi:heme NO-binding protein, partial [Frigidibacter sp. MR17.24]
HGAVRAVPAALVAPVLAGLVRAMADDYGALALIDLAETAPDRFEIVLDLLEDRYAPGRGFRLAAAAGGE